MDGFPEVKTASVKRLGLSLAGWMLIAVAGMHALFAQVDAKGLKQALKAKPQWELRSYSADAVAKYKWIDGQLVGETPTTSTLGAFKAASVDLKNGKLAIRGSRSTLVHDVKTDKMLAAGSSPMTLEIDMSGAPVSLKSENLTNALFFPDLQSATDVLPEHLKRVILGSAPQEAKCDCFRFFDNGHWVEEPKGGANVLQEPRLVWKVDPEFSEEARSQKFSGYVMVTMTVNPRGTVEDVWVVRPVGMGLDEKAAEAVRQYRFEPARYNGRPVSVQLNVEVNFQIF